MTEIPITIAKETIARAVYRLTANAEMERGDDSHVATKDNEAFIFAIIDDAAHILSDTIMRYGYATAGADNIEITVYMPSNWGGDGDVLLSAMRVFVENFVLAKWFGLSGSAESYNLAQERALQSVKSVLEKRIKPAR